MNYRQLVLAGILGLLAFALWASPEFKQIAAGVAIFLFGMLSLENGFPIESLPRFRWSL